jgi:hypothetical protein
MRAAHRAILAAHLSREPFKHSTTSEPSGLMSLFGGVALFFMVLLFLGLIQ